MFDRTEVAEKSRLLHDRQGLTQTREGRVERIALVMCGSPAIWETMGWPDVTDIHNQVQLGGSRADIVLQHADRSVTLVEVKPAGLGLRDYCTGIGQLAYQSIMAMSVYQTLDIRRVLCLPGPVPSDLVLATTLTDIEFLPLPTPAEWEGLLGSV